MRPKNAKIQIMRIRKTKRETRTGTWLLKSRLAACERRD